jgi:hypothetical protein
MEIKIGKTEITTPSTSPKRISMLLWGPSGGGKTTLAATAPGTKLWISFDPDGTDVLSYRDDVIVMDLASSPDNIVMGFRKSDGGYGNKNTWTQLIVKNLLQITGRLNRHVIFIAHEDKPEKDDKGVILYISIMLGSSLNEQLPTRISEIWNLHDTGKERRIAIRACRARKPMKTRMFLTAGEPEFVWSYDADMDKGPGIADWYSQWVRNAGRKIELP